MADEQKISDLLIQWDEQRQAGQEPSASDLCSDCPELTGEVASRIQALKNTDWMFGDDTAENDEFLSLPDETTSETNADSIELPETALTTEALAAAVAGSGLSIDDNLKSVQEKLPADHSAPDLARELIWQGHLTVFQASILLQQERLPLVLGDYEIRDRIGAGGMGEVYKARHRRMKRVVALKILPQRLIDDEAALKRFNREVEIVASLEHPNIVTAHDAGEQDGTHYLIMQYVDGCDLTTLVRTGGKLTVEQAINFTLQAARGLAHAHQQGVTHRDIKPSNILINKRGQVKILDLGLARVDLPSAQQVEQRDGLTTTGAVMGTVDYMSPEQAVNTRTADHRADIYSLGCTLHFLLTGDPPYGGETMMERLLAHREQDTPSLQERRSDVPAELDAIFQRLLAKQPDERFSSMASVVAALESLSAELTSATADSSDSDSATSPLPGELTASREVAPEDSATELYNKSVVAVEQQEPEPELKSVNETLNQSTAGTDPSLAPTIIKEAKSNYSRNVRLKWMTLAVLLLGAAFYAASPLFKVKTEGGTLVFEGDPAVLQNATVTIDGEEVDLDIDGKNFTVGLDKTSGDVRIVSADGTELLAERFTFKVGQNRLPFTVTSRPHEMRQANTNSSPRSTRPTVNKPINSPAQHRELAEFVLQNGGELSLNLDLSGGYDGTTLKQVKDLPQKEFTVHEIRGPFITEDNSIELAERLRNVNVPIMQIQFAGDAGKALANMVELTADYSISFGPGANFADGLLALRHLAANELGLGSLPLQGEHFRHLAKITSPGPDHFRINLRGTNLTDADLKYFESLKELTSLNATATSVTKSGVTALSKALPNCRIEWDGGVIEPTMSADRRAAEWVLANGGQAGIRRSDGSHFVADKQVQLPTETFTITGATLNNVTDDALKNLAGLPTPTLDLHLAGSPLTGRGLDVFKGRKLNWLQLSSTQVTDESLSAVLPDLEFNSLELEGTPIGDATLKLVKGREYLWWLKLSSTQITDAGLQHLDGIEIVQLGVQRTGITGAGFEAIDDLSGLLKLQADRTQFSDDALKFISRAQNLTDLNLALTPVTDTGLKHLENLGKLRKLNVAVSKVTEAGVTALSKALPNCRIEWDGGVIEPVTDPSRSVAEWVFQHGGRVFHTQGQYASSVDELPQNSFKLLTVDIPKSSKLIDADLAQLNKLPQLDGLTLQDTPNLTDEALATIDTRLGITQLSLNGNQFTDVTARSVSQFQTLQTVAIKSSALTDKGLAELASLPHLTRLYVQKSRAVDGSGLAPLIRTHKLTSLGLLNTSVSAETLQSLRSLKLERLELQGSPVTYAGVKAISEIRSLNFLGLRFSSDVTDAGLSHLKNLTALTVLDVQKTSVTQAGVTALSKALPNCRIEWDGGVIEPKNQ